MKKLLPIILMIVGIAGGIGAGLALRPEHETATAVPPCGPGEQPQLVHEDDHDDGHGSTGPEYVKLNNQFVVPIVDKDRVASMVVLSLSVEANAGLREDIYAREPKLRDMFLQVLFDHANVGGFRGAFTNANNMDILRNALLDAARKVLGRDVTDILITDIARQDV